MKIEFLGGSTFVLSTDQTTLVLDPSSDSALKQPKSKADICVLTDDRYSDISNIGDAKADKPLFVIDSQGEYEVGGIYVETFALHIINPEVHNDMITKIRIDGINILYLGYLEKSLSQKEIDLVGEIDMMIAPVGHDGFIKLDEVNQIINSADPEIVIPALYSEGGCHSNISNLESLDVFMKDRGIVEPEKMKALKIKEEDFVAEDESSIRIIVLEK